MLVCDKQRCNCDSCNVIENIVFGRGRWNEDIDEVGGATGRPSGSVAAGPMTGQLSGVKILPHSSNLICCFGIRNELEKISSSSQ